MFVAAYLLLIPVFALPFFPMKKLGLELANSKPSVLVKIAGYSVVALGAVPFLFWLYVVYWSFFVST